MPYEALWKLALDVYNTVEPYLPESWVKLPVEDLNPEDIEAKFRKMKGQANTAKNTFDQLRLQKPKNLADGMLKTLENFEPWIRIIRALNTEGIKKKHLDQINAKCNEVLDGELQIELNMDITTLQTFRITQCTDEIEELADIASKEWSNEKLLENMEAEWKPIRFETKEHKDTYILDGESVELITQVLDDHLIKTQTMKGSPYAVPFLDQIVKWEELIERTIYFLEYWVKVQGTWRYLEPVFSSEDLMNQMRQHGTIFREVDRVWKRLMKDVTADPSAASVWEIADLGGMLKNADIKLEEVQKGLNQYLESKQGLFPRFYFLSNEELLEILSETKEPTKVQPHIHKCFEGIDRLEFDDDKKILGMVSSDKEKVTFTRVIDPVASRGNVEEWLLQIEDIMFKTIKSSTEGCLADYGKKEREKWVLGNWPGMAIIGVDMMQWTQGAEENMKKGGVPGLELYYDKLGKMMDGIVNLVRQPITNLQRSTIEAMIVLDVHARDVIKEDLIELNEASVNSFAWLK